VTDPRAEIAATARMLARARLVHAFGHVSMRVGDGIAITSTRPLLAASDDDVVLLDGDGTPVEGPSGELPLETPMHRAILAARDDVGAIARGHPDSVVAWGTGLVELPLLHGLGALAGQRVRVHPDADLIATDEQASGVVRTLGDGVAVILRSNGALACGSSPLEAATRLFFLEDRARVALARFGGGHMDDEVSGEVWEQRMRHVDNELHRARAWFERAFGDPDVPTGRGEDR
jgi:HCOMODA/2-hydroxy-3-carboxy-muconic semialdehyde decarboxylase